MHEIKRKMPNKKSAQVGRGGKRGKTSGRGTKGQKARAGHKIRPEIRDTVKKIPKLRGYRFKSFAQKPAVLNLDKIAENFKDGDTVNLSSLLEKGLVSRKSSGKMYVKILGKGRLDKKLAVQGLLISESAKTAVEKAGGKVEK